MIYQNKKDESIQKLIQKNQSTEILVPKSQIMKEKNFGKKKEIRKVKSLVPEIKKKFNLNGYDPDIYKYNHHWQLTPTWSQWIEIGRKNATKTKTDKNDS